MPISWYTDKFGRRRPISPKRGHVRVRDLEDIPQVHYLQSLDKSPEERRAILNQMVQEYGDSFVLLWLRNLPPRESENYLIEGDEADIIHKLTTALAEDYRWLEEKKGRTGYEGLE